MWRENLRQLHGSKRIQKPIFPPREIPNSLPCLGVLCSEDPHEPVTDRPEVFPSALAATLSSRKRAQEVFQKVCFQRDVPEVSSSLCITVWSALRGLEQTFIPGVDSAECYMTFSVFPRNAPTSSCEDTPKARPSFSSHTPLTKLDRSQTIFPDHFGSLLFASRLLVCFSSRLLSLPFYSSRVFPRRGGDGTCEALAPQD